MNEHLDKFYVFIFIRFFSFFYIPESAPPMRDTRTSRSASRQRAACCDVASLASWRRLSRLSRPLMLNLSRASASANAVCGLSLGVGLLLRVGLDLALGLVFETDCPQLCLCFDFGNELSSMVFDLHD